MECTDKGTFDPIDTGPYHIVWWCHLVIIHFVAATKCNVILVGRLCLERFQMEFVEEGYFKCCREEHPLPRGKVILANLIIRRNNLGAVQVFN
ncbi:hypothetical protein D5086_022624 [Populus alba]|uniref:Uncharacterized protein n=1 Tax=Populus alba TaxID=43335 RepID=A0ACC4BGI5_POPAL